MKSVLISIQPKWCELISSGKKTVEIRKTKPKIDVPFKCYIYETNWKDNTYWKNRHKGKLGKVIGEFVCDHFYGIINFLPYESDDNHHTIFPCVLEQTCLTEDEIDEYLGQKDGFGWHISDLVIYDKPKELSEFSRECDYEKDCGDCPYLYVENTPNCYETWCEVDGHIPIKRPPQSWCYVEERRSDNEKSMA